MNLFKEKLNNKSNNQGSILLMALLIMSGSIVTGLAIGNIILSEVRQSRNIDDAITAYYVAESGLEQGVYLYRKDYATFQSEIDSLNAGDPPPSSPSDCYFDPGNFTGKDCETYSQESASIDISILPNTVQQINLYNESLSTGYNVESLVVNWSDANPDNGIEPWLEMEVVTLQPNFTNDDPVVFVQNCGTGPICTAINGTNYSVASNYFEISKNYIVRFRALYDTINLQAIAYDQASGSGNITGSKSIDIYTTGEFRTSQQSMKATLNTGVTTTKPFVDFVLYSECDLVKGFGMSSSCP